MPDLGVPTVCSDCGAPIIWLLTVKNNRMPVDANPDPERGNVIRQGDRAGVLGPRQAAGARKAGTPMRTHHAVTCPYASRWQNPRRGGGRR